MAELLVQVAEDDGGSYLETASKKCILAAFTCYVKQSRVGYPSFTTVQTS